MLIDAVALFFGGSLLLYCLLGGADYGGGILALWHSVTGATHQREAVDHAIAPVWEANHMWLILAVVILFNGFPAAFGAIFTVYHIPLTLVLLGIILRGCAFTFAHYDAVQSTATRYYHHVFVAASVFTPVMLGMVAGALLLGHVPTDPVAAGFAATYIWSWCNPFCFAVGIFTALLFAFLAAVYLVGETDDMSTRQSFVRQARLLNVAAVTTGAAAFVAAHGENLPLAAMFLRQPASVACMAMATGMLGPLWYFLHRHRVTSMRVCAAAQMTWVLLGWFALQYPRLMVTPQGGWTLAGSAAPPATMRALLGALLVGTALIFPALVYLFKIFKSTPSTPARQRPSVGR